MKFFTNKGLFCPFIIAMLVLFPFGISAQNVATYYTFAQSNQTYVPITGGTIIAGNEDSQVYPVTIPSFNFCGAFYTSVFVSSNGFLTFGATNPGTTNSSPLSSATAYNGAVSPFGADLEGSGAAGAAPEIRYQQLGDTLIFQWRDYSKWAQDERCSFQVQLITSTSKIRIVYGGTIIPGSSGAFHQVGLRGPNNTFNPNVNNRQVGTGTTGWVNSTAGTASTSGCYFYSGYPNAVPAVGTTFSWTPAPIDMMVTAFISPGTATCKTANETISVTIKNQGAAIMDFTANPVTVTCNVTGPIAASYTQTITSGTLAIFATQTVTFTTSGDMHVAGTYTLTATTAVTGDANAGNNSQTINRAVTTPAVSVSPATSTTCEGSSVNLSATGTAFGNGIANTSGVNSTAQPIPDNDAAGINSVITISGASSPISVVSVKIDTIIHALDQNLVIKLIAPNGTNITLANQRGLGANYYNTIFTPTAVNSISTGSSPFTGTFAPEMPFSTLTGASNGNWTLNVADILPTQTGTLRRWTLTLNTPNGIVSYSWSPSTGLSATNVSNPVATPTVTTTYSVTATDQWGCSWSGSSGISVNPNPVISVAGNTTVCEGNSTVLTASGADTYVWSSGGSDAAETVSPVTPTTYTVTGTDANGCIDSAMVTVNINANPTIAVSGFFTICSGSSTTLTANGADTYAWNTGATTDAETVSPASTTSYTVTGTDGNGCTDSEVVTVTVDQSPVVTVSGNTTICEGNSTTLTATGADFYSWSSGGNMASETVSPAATATFVVTGTATNNCTSTETVTVTVNSNPVITVSGNTIICSGSTSTLTASGADIYSWNTGGTNAAETVSPALTTIYTVSGMDANNCTGSTTVTVIVNENPIVTANATSSTVCGGSPVTLTGAGADSYSWTGGVTDGVSFTPSVSDTYTVTGTDANNCSSTASVTVNVNAAPVVNLGADIAVCSGPVILDAQNPGSTFFWDDASMTQTKAVNSSGIYWVDVTDGSGCTSRDSIEVTINANPVVTLGNDITQCGGTVLLDAGNPGATFLWNDNSTSQTLAASSSGTYYVTVTFAGGCDATDTIGVTINPLPAVTLSLPMDTLCQNMVGSITLSGESPANGTWSGNGVSGNNFTPSMVPSGSTAINYTFTDGNGCSNTAVDSFWVDPCSWIDQYGTGESILLYPNPTNGLFTLVINSSGVSEVSLRITNLQGQIVFQENVNTSGNEITKQIDISALANGAYFVEVVSDSGSQVSKVIKQQ